MHVARRKFRECHCRKDDTTDLEQAQTLDLVQFVEREAVVDAGRYDQQVSREDVDANPLVREMFCRRIRALDTSTQRLLTTHRVRRKSRIRRECIVSHRHRACVYLIW